MSFQGGCRWGGCCWDYDIMKPMLWNNLVCICIWIEMFSFSSSQSASSYIIRNPQPRRSSQSQTARGRDEEQDDIVSADVEEVLTTI